MILGVVAILAAAVVVAYVLITISGWVSDQSYPTLRGERTLARYVADQWRHAWHLLGRLW